MEAGNYDALARLQRYNWWYRSRRDLLARALANAGPFDRALEVGCGTGSNLPVLTGLCKQLVATDLHTSALTRCLPSRSSLGVECSLATSDVLSLPFADACFDLIVCCDVLEHVEDLPAARELERVLAPGGLLLATVPAHRHLWNENDDFSHHLRRYSRTELQALFGQLESLTVVDMSFWNFLLYLPTLGYCTLRRWIGPGKQKNNLERIPSVANLPLTGFSLLENRLRDWLPAPTGTSLVALARRRSAAPNPGAAG